MDTFALRNVGRWTLILVATCIVSTVGWSVLWTHELTMSLLPWLVPVTAFLCAIAWTREWRGSRVAALLFISIWMVANWWFVEGLALFASFAVFGFV